MHPRYPKAMSALGLAVVSMFGGSAIAEDALCREVGEDWVWFSDHVALTIDYHVAGPAGRIYEIGTGISFRHRPLGSKSSHEGAYAVTAYGAGAIHIRADDGGAPFMVCVAQGDMRLIEVCGEYRLDCTF